MQDSSREFVEVFVRGLMVHGPEEFPVLLLHWEHGDRVIPVWIDDSTAVNFAAHDASMTQDRPGVHEVLADTVTALGAKIVRGAIVSHFEGVFHGELQLDNGVNIDIRPSDLIITCDFAEVPLVIARDIVDAVSVSATRFLDDVVGDTALVNDDDEESLKDFAEFLDSIDATDFTEK